MFFDRRQELNELKVLHIMPYVPSLTSGGPVRDYNIIKCLSTEGIISEVISSIIDGDNENNIKNVLKVVNVDVYKTAIVDLSLIQKSIAVLTKKMYPPILAYDNVGHIKMIEKRINAFCPSIIHSQHSIEALPTLKAIKRSKYQGCKVITLHNVDHLNVLRTGIETRNYILKFARKRAASGLKKHELSILENFDHIITVSNFDKQAYVSEGILKDKIDVIPNGVDTKFFNPHTLNVNNPYPKKNNVLFMGKMSYLPNVYGLSKYLKYVHPLVKKVDKNYILNIIGKDCPNWLEVMAENDTSLNPIGYVNDVRDYILNADVCIAPLTAGSGTRLKILEYMALGKPVVSTQLGAEGIDAENNKNLIIENDWSNFAQGIIELLNDKDYANKIGSNGRLLVEEKYDWMKIIKKQIEIYKNLLD